MPDQYISTNPTNSKIIIIYIIFLKVVLIYINLSFHCFIRNASLLTQVNVTETLHKSRSICVIYIKIK